MLESKLEGLFRQLVIQEAGTSMKFVSPGLAGAPDRLVIRPDGGIEFVELKKEDGKLSATQKNCHKYLESKGARVYVLYGETEVRAYVQRWRCM